EPGNPLSAGALHELPGQKDGRRFYWKIDSQGTRESIVAFASREPNPALEHELELLPHATIGAPLRVSNEGAERLRGMGELVSEPHPAGSKPKLAEILARYAGTLDAERRPWVWQIEFEKTPGGH
ncbi:MAG TPA: hypothetical protein VGQ14_04440, partial [Candidatus Eisenbacteria bacterium]|nr:hypothetical protein [Candidatus Eisenbacteria bacterium]